MGEHTRCDCPHCLAGTIPGSGCSLPAHEFTEVNGTRCWNCGAGRPTPARYSGPIIAVDNHTDDAAYRYDSPAAFYALDGSETDVTYTADAELALARQGWFDLGNTGGGCEVFFVRADLAGIDALIAAYDADVDYSEGHDRYEIFRAALAAKQGCAHCGAPLSKNAFGDNVCTAEGCFLAVLL